MSNEIKPPTSAAISASECVRVVVVVVVNFISRAPPPAQPPSSVQAGAVSGELLNTASFEKPVSSARSKERELPRDSAEQSVCVCDGRSAVEGGGQVFGGEGYVAGKKRGREWSIPGGSEVK